MKKALAVLIMSIAMPLAAQSNEAGLWLTMQINESGGRFAAGETEEARFDNGSGFGVSVSRKFGDRISGELALFRTSSSAEVREAGVTLAELGDIDLMPLTAMARYHFLAGRKVDLYAGAGIAHVMAGELDSADLRAAGLAPVRLDDETTMALGAGVSIALTPRVAIAADARFVSFEISGRATGDDERFSSDLNPLLLSAGIKVRF